MMESPLQGRPAFHAGRAATLCAALRNPSARRVLVAFFLFNTQEYGIWVAVVIYAYAQGGATTAGIVLIAQLVPAMFFAPLASVLGDRMRRGRALMLGYATQAIAAAALAVALAWAPPLFACLAAIISTSLITLTRPVHNAILPELADTPDELTAANAASGAMEAVGNLAGPLVVSVVIGPGGAGMAVGVMAALTALAALLAVRLPLHDRPQAESLTHTRIVTDAMEGARELRQERGATLLLLIGGSQFLLIGMLDVFYVMLAIDVLHAGESAAGVLASGFGAGGLLGAGVAVALVARPRLAPPMAGGLAACGVMLAALSGATSVTVTFVLLAICGAGRSFFDVAARMLLQRSVRDEVLARVFGLQEALVMAGLAVGAIVAPVLVATLDEGPAMLASGILFVGIAVVAARSLRTVDERAFVPGPELNVLRQVPFLRLLPRHALERLSWHAVPSPLRPAQW